MAQSAAAAPAPKRSIETARRSGPDLDVSFVLAFMFLWVSETRRKPNCFFRHLFSSISPKRPVSPAINSLLVRPAYIKRDVYGRPSPTCDLVRATSVALREPSAFTSSRKLEPVTA